MSAAVRLGPPESAKAAFSRSMWSSTTLKSPAVSACPAPGTAVKRKASAPRAAGL